LEKCITRPKKFGKGKHEWNKACIASSLHPRKLNNLVKTRYYFFELSFEFFFYFNFCIFFSYKIVNMMNVELQICKQTILFQKTSIITMNKKLMEELQNPLNFDNIMDEDFGVVNELTLLVSNIRKEVYVVLD